MRMFFIRRTVIAPGVFFILWSGLMAAQVSDGTASVEQRIQRIQDRLVEPFLRNGKVTGPTLADRMKELRVPGVSVAVIHEGAIEWARGFGVARIGGPAVTPETLFQAASISKPVTGFGVLRLVESGKFSLDTDVNQYLKSWRVTENEFTAKKKVTIRSLLSHTAGMTVHGFPGYASGDPVPTVVQILNGQYPANTPRIDVDISPGTLWRYSGGGYVVMQQMLEDETRTPFAELMQQTVLDPIGMKRSTYGQPLPAAHAADVATPYRPDGEPVAGGPHTYPEMAPAGLWTTPSDLAHFALEMQRALARNSTLLSASMAREMLTPVMQKNARGYGLSLRTGGSGDHLNFQHGGANEGYRCELFVYNSGDGAIVMTNSDNGSDLADDILRTIAYEYHWPDLQPKALRRFPLPGAVFFVSVAVLLIAAGVYFIRLRRSRQTAA